VCLATLASRCNGQQQYGNESGPIVDLGYAQYRGNTTYRGNYSVDVFYGIRYAQAPVGDLRWQPPQDIESHNDYNPSEIIDAQTPSPSCVQGTPAWRAYASNIPTPVAVTGQEDCLLLNVYVPQRPKATALPVMLMVHGGGYTQGSANGGGNQGQAIVSTANGSMIYVSIQYRLGAYGFLSGAEIQNDGVANAGLLDMNSAFLWVQRHIRSFGGNPASVTIIGGSAGGSAGMGHSFGY
jgi:carboxylesterase type B